MQKIHKRSENFSYYCLHILQQRYHRLSSYCSRQASRSNNISILQHSKHHIICRIRFIQKPSYHSIIHIIQENYSEQSHFRTQLAHCLFAQLEKLQIRAICGMLYDVHLTCASSSCSQVADASTGCSDKLCKVTFFNSFSISASKESSSVILQPSIIHSRRWRKAGSNPDKKVWYTVGCRTERRTQLWVVTLSEMN